MRSSPEHDVGCRARSGSRKPVDLIARGRVRTRIWLAPMTGALGTGYANQSFVGRLRTVPAIPCVPSPRGGLVQLRIVDPPLVSGEFPEAGVEVGSGAHRCAPSIVWRRARASAAGSPARVMLVNSVMEEERLRRQAQDRIRQGKLPAHAPLRTWAGPGTEYPCALCDLPITQNEIEFALEFEVSPNTISLRFHSLCHAAWELERRRLPERPG